MPRENIKNKQKSDGIPRKQSYAIPKNKNTKLAKKLLNKNVKRTLEEMESPPKKFIKTETKSVAVKTGYEDSKYLYRLAIYYNTKEGAVSHYNAVMKHKKKYNIRNVVMGKLKIEPTVLKIFVGSDILSIDERKELMTISKASAVISASLYNKELRNLLLLKYDDATVAKEIYSNACISFRGRNIVPEYSDELKKLLFSKDEKTNFKNKKERKNVVLEEMEDDDTTDQKEEVEDSDEEVEDSDEEVEDSDEDVEDSDEQEEEHENDEEQEEEHENDEEEDDE